MKVGSAVLGLHVVAIAAFALTQGCVTTESHGSGRGAGARHRGIVKHQHSGKDGIRKAVEPPMAISDHSVMGEEPLIGEGTTFVSPIPHVAPVAPSATTETYIVRPGDMLSQLAVRFDTTTKTLISMNNLSNPDVLYVGQELRVPSGSFSSVGSSRPSKTYSSGGKGGEYTIQRGDTLSGIAVAAGVSLDDLRALNSIKDDKIFEGKTIYIPSGGKIPSRTQTVPSKSTPKTVPEKNPPVVSEPISLDPVVLPVAMGGSKEMIEVFEYVVYPKDTLAKIANDNAVSKSEIMRLNNITDEFAIKEGQRLRIPISD